MGRALARLIARVIEAQSRTESSPTADTEDTDLVAQQSEILVMVWKREGVWRGLVKREDRTDLVPPGSLEDVILGAQSTIFDFAPIYLGHVAYHGAFRWANIGLKVRDYTDLDADEILILIDAGAFDGQLDLSECFIEHVDLSQQVIAQKWSRSHDAYRGGSALWKSPRTEGLSLRRACLKNVRFTKCNLQGADLENADLSGASIGDTNLQDAHMHRANLSNANLLNMEMQRADLMSASFAGASLLRTRLDDAMLFGTDWRHARAVESRFDRAYLAGAHLEDADFYQVGDGALSSVSWSSAFLDRTRLRRQHLGNNVGEEAVARSGKREIRGRGSVKTETITLRNEDSSDLYRQAREVYLRLKNNFNSIGRYRDASWAYQLERKMEREELWRAWKPRDRSTWGNLKDWAINVASWATTGYGERPWNTVLIGAGTILVLAVLFIGFNLVDPKANRLGMAAGRLCFWDALVYSGATFFTMGIGSMEPMGRTMRLLSVFESALGIGLVALLIFTLGNRISRS